MSMIDMHAHYLSPSVLRKASAGSGPVGLAPDGRSFLFPSGPSRPVPPPLCDLADRLRWMDERAIERQILAPWMDITGDDLPPDAAAAWCRTMNDSCAADIGDEPRFGALAALPVVDGEAAARELVRSVEQLGFCGGAIPTQVGGRDLDVAGLEPLWEAAGSLGALLFIHPFRVMGGDRLKVHFLNNVCGNPFETTLAALRLYFARTFTRMAGPADPARPWRWRPADAGGPGRARVPSRPRLRPGGRRSGLHPAVLLLRHHPARSPGPDPADECGGAGPDRGGDRLPVPHDPRPPHRPCPCRPPTRPASRRTRYAAS